MTGGPSPKATPAAAGIALPALHSLLWQGLGSASTLAAAGWVSWRFGLAAQGEFGLAKSWFDAAAPIAALGLPQGLLHLQYRLKVPAAALLPWLARGALGLTAVAVISAAALQWQRHSLAAAVLLSLPFAVGHLLARSVLLAQRGPALFGFVTALPALLVLAGVLAQGALDRRGDFNALLLIAVVASGMASIALSWRSAGVAQHVAWPRRDLWQVSLQSWLQAALGALLVAGLLSTVAGLGYTGAQLGAASLALQVYQVFAVIAGLLAPLLFDRLARQHRPTLRELPAAARHIAAAMLALTLAGLVTSQVRVDWASWLLPLSLMLAAGIAAVAARVAGTVLLARGAYAELSLQAVWRLLLALGLTALALQWLPAPAAVALALLVVEAATWWRTSTLVRGGRE